MAPLTLALDHPALTLFPSLDVAWLGRAHDPNQIGWSPAHAHVHIWWLITQPHMNLARRTHTHTHAGVLNNNVHHIYGMVGFGGKKHDAIFASERYLNWNQSNRFKEASTTTATMPMITSNYTVSTAYWYKVISTGIVPMPMKLTGSDKSFFPAFLCLIDLWARVGAFFFLTSTGTAYRPRRSF